MILKTDAPASEIDTIIASVGVTPKHKYDMGTFKGFAADLTDQQLGWLFAFLFIFLFYLLTDMPLLTSFFLFLLLLLFLFWCSSCREDLVFSPGRLF